MPRIDTYKQFKALPLLQLANLNPGDILVKKVFPDMERHGIEKVITKMQGKFDKPEKISIDRGWLRKNEEIKFENFGSPSAEHAAIIIRINGEIKLAESQAGGVTRTDVNNVSHERYVVWRCHQQYQNIRNAAADVAERMTGVPTGNFDGGYGYLGAATSSYRNTSYQHNNFTNNIVTKDTESYLKQIIDFCYEARGARPNLFCSEFVMACYEAGSYRITENTAFGTNPKAMSPMYMENVLNYSEKVEIIGRVDSAQDILFNAVKNGVEEYQKSLSGIFGGIFRKPSEESLRALGTLQILLEWPPGDILFPAMEHYLTIVSKVPYEYDADLSFNLSAPLSKKSTFYDKLIGNVKKTGLFRI